MQENAHQPFKQPVVQSIPGDHQDSDPGKTGLMEEVSFSNWFGISRLFEALAENRMVPVVFPIREYWLDVGRHADLEKAGNDHPMWLP